MPRKRAAADAPEDPDKLVRERAGTYRSADGRFEVREGQSGWYLIDSAQTNELGQEIVQGPFPTLKGVREALPAARSTQIVPLATRRGKASPKRTAGSSHRSKRSEQPAPASWIDELPRAEAQAVRRLVSALEREGLADAEALVKLDRDGLGPAIATRRIERRLEAIAEEFPDGARDGVREIMRRVAEILSVDGARGPNGVPGWTLVELGDDGVPPNRRILLR